MSKRRAAWQFGFGCSRSHQIHAASPLMQPRQLAHVPLPLPLVPLSISMSAVRASLSQCARVWAPSSRSALRKSGTAPLRGTQAVPAVLVHAQTMAQCSHAAFSGNLTHIQARSFCASAEEIIESKDGPLVPTTRPLRNVAVIAHVDHGAWGCCVLLCCPWGELVVTHEWWWVSRQNHPG